ncbi:hypothetical protein QKU48_gp0763 [Fadolivirus algeromassiliense]|jgi:hypothetical protein|uniref:Uncharacterized protein n=1 Tax=Fadolivirus FV1/VV64 TaxID=3070911 RepID=A0A7D3R166_9VIRU|nr:hypothetical protein QKU48_gp0763 [Fadolivirus algeromassiliense]QKF94221.1 hypothetical protein Fadolivirus_1_763 [Fadolivirus FV1/VV64]
MASIMSFLAGFGIGAVIIGYSKMHYSTNDFVKVIGDSIVNINGKSFNGKDIIVRNGKVIVNGKEEQYYDNNQLPNTYTVEDILITNGRVIVSGKDEQYYDNNQLPHTYTVEINGNPQKVETMGNVKVTGDCGNINTMGDVTVGGNSGSINTMGTVTVGGISGKISTMGTVNVSKN